MSCCLVAASFLALVGEPICVCVQGWAKGGLRTDRFIPNEIPNSSTRQSKHCWQQAETAREAGAFRARSIRSELSSLSSQRDEATERVRPLRVITSPFCSPPLHRDRPTQERAQISLFCFIRHDSRLVSMDWSLLRVAVAAGCWPLIGYWSLSNRQIVGPPIDRRSATRAARFFCSCWVGFFGRIESERIGIGGGPSPSIGSEAFAFLGPDRAAESRGAWWLEGSSSAGAVFPERMRWDGEREHSAVVGRARPGAQERHESKEAAGVQFCSLLCVVLAVDRWRRSR